MDGLRVARQPQIQQIFEKSLTIRHNHVMDMQIERKFKKTRHGVMSRECKIASIQDGLNKIDECILTHSVRGVVKIFPNEKNLQRINDTCCLRNKANCGRWGGIKDGVLKDILKLIREKGFIIRTITVTPADSH